MSELKDFYEFLPSVKTAKDKEPAKTNEEEKPDYTSKEAILKTREEKPTADTNEKLILSEKHIVFGNPRKDNRKPSGVGVLGKLGNRFVTLDLQNGKPIAIFGTMGSGKSYLCGVLTEMMVMPIKNLNYFSGQPSAVIIFNFRKDSDSRFEYGSYIMANDNKRQSQELRKSYNSNPIALPKERIVVCAHQLMIKKKGHKDYKGLKTRRLLFKPQTLNATDWLLLMGNPNNKEALYIQYIENIIDKLNEEERLTLDNLKWEVEHSISLTAQQKTLAGLRLQLASKYLSDEHGITWEKVIKPGTITILDFRKENMKPEDALRLVLIAMRSATMKTSEEIHKFFLLDEFHEYYDKSFSDLLTSYYRMVRHKNTSFCIATQNTEKVNKEILENFSNRFIFKVHNKTWETLCKADPYLKDSQKGGIAFHQVADLQTEAGECYVKFDDCSESSLRMQTRKIEVRPRATKHGGSTVQSV